MFYCPYILEMEDCANNDKPTLQYIFSSSKNANEKNMYFSWQSIHVHVATISWLSIGTNKSQKLLKVFTNQHLVKYPESLDDLFSDK